MPNSVFKIIGVVFCIFISSGPISAQTGCPSVDAGPAVTLPCGTTCTTLHATAFPTGSTTSYSVSQIAYTPQPYNIGTPVLVHNDDHFSDTITLPFNFCFFGNVYNHVLIGANEIISFNDSNAFKYNNFQIDDTVPAQGDIPPDIQNSVMCPWQDIDCTLHGNIYYQIVGTAPCRMFIATWDSVPYYGSEGSRDSTLCSSPEFATSQVILYETTNAIDINIQMKGVCTQWNGGAAIEGILNDSGTVAYTVPGRNATQWTAQDDAWRFTPNGTPGDYSIAWYQGDSLLGNSDSIQVCPNAALQTTYTAIATITPCGGGAQVVVADSVVVSLTGTLLAGIDSFHNVTCNGACNGKGWAYTSGGAIPVTFGWADVTTKTPLGSTLNVAALCPGTYVFAATDANGCTRTDTMNITQPSAQGIILLSQTPTSCVSNDGTVTVTDTGGTPLYNGGLPYYLYNWSNQVTGPVDTALGQGQISVTVTDANNCTASQSFITLQTSTVFTNPLVTDDRCAQSNDGSVAANPSGGTPPYTFAWNNSDNNDSVANNLGPGTYTCTVTDKYGCTALVSDSVSAPAPLEIIGLQSVAVKCLNQSNGLIVASASGGTAPYHFSASPDNVNFTADSDGVMDGLSPGNYTVYLDDNNGCVQTAIINVPNATPDYFEITIDSTLCYGYSDGALQIVDSSPQNRPYQYSIDSTGQFQYASDFNNLSPGNHTVIAINKNGCKTDTLVSIPQPPAIIVGIEPDSLVLALGQSQQVAVSYLNATGNTSFSWSPDFGLSCIDCADPIVSPYVSQEYNVTVSSVNQTATCYGTASLYVTVLPAPPFYIPNAFTPNSDGNNDFFEIYGESIKVVDLKIFNRWGVLVFQTNDQFKGWDGTYKGQLQPPGVFTYNAVITFLDNTQTEKSGSVTLLR